MWSLVNNSQYYHTVQRCWRDKKAYSEHRRRLAASLDFCIGLQSYFMDVINSVRGCLATWNKGGESEWSVFSDLHLTIF